MLTKKKSKINPLKTNKLKIVDKKQSVEWINNYQDWNFFKIRFEKNIKNMKRNFKFLRKKNEKTKKPKSNKWENTYYRFRIKS